MSLLFLFILVAILAEAFINKKDIFSPARFFIIVYSSLLSVYFLNLSSLQTPWLATTHILLWGSMLIFIGATQVIALLARVQEPSYQVSFGSLRERLASESQKMDWNFFSIIIKICASIFIFSYFGSFALVHQIPIFAKDPDSVRINFLLASLPTNIGLFFGPISLMLTSEMFIFRNFNMKEKLVYIFLFTTVFLLYSTIVTRVDLFRVIFFIAIIYNYGKRNFQLKHILVLVSLGIALFMIFFLIRTSNEGFGMVNNFLKMRLPPEYFWASNFYAYIVNNFWNLDFAVQKYVEGSHYYPFGHGFYFFRSLFFFTSTEGAFYDFYGMENIFNPEITRIRGLNSVVYVWHLYHDFGPLGLFSFLLLMGSSLSLFYHNTIKNINPLRVSLWGILIGIIFFSFLIPLWEFWFTYLNIAILLIAHKKITT